MVEGVSPELLSRLGLALDSVWMPSEESAQATNVGRLMRERGFESVAQLHAWSVGERAEFWDHMIERLGIRIAQPYRKRARRLARRRAARLAAGREAQYR